MRPGKKDAAGLTPKQRDTLETIQALTDSQGYPPTLMEAGAVLGVASNRVFYRAESLRRRGFMAPSHGQARSLVLTKRGLAAVMGAVMVQIEGDAQ